MPGRRRDGHKLWAAERDDAAALQSSSDVDVNPKQRKVLDVQTSAGNVAATAMVQRKGKTADKAFNAMDEFIRDGGPSAAELASAKQFKESNEAKAAPSSGGIGRLLGKAAKGALEQKAAPSSGGIGRLLGKAAKGALEQKAAPSSGGIGRLLGKAAKGALEQKAAPSSGGIGRLLGKAAKDALEQKGAKEPPAASAAAASMWADTSSTPELDDTSWKQKA